MCLRGRGVSQLGHGGRGGVGGVLLGIGVASDIRRHLACVEAGGSCSGLSMVFNSELSNEILAVYGDELRKQFNAGGTWYAAYKSLLGAHPLLGGRCNKFTLRKVWERFGRVKQRPAASSPVPASSPVRLGRLGRGVARGVRRKWRSGVLAESGGGRSKYPVGMTGRSVNGSTLALGIDDEWGNLIATGLKHFDCRPGREPFLSLWNEAARVCFQVGAGSVPWYILCEAGFAVKFPSLRAMLREERGLLLPFGPHGMEEAVEYFKGLSEGYSMAADGPWLFFRVDVIAVWCGWA